MNLRFFPLLLLLMTLSFGAHAQMPPSHGESAPLADRVEPAPELPRGSIEATLLDAQGQPVANQDVRLGILFSKVAEGESRSSRTGKTNASGVVRFDGLDSSTSYSYSISTKQGPGEFSTHPFPLRDSGGMRATLHVYPPTHDGNQAVVGMRGFFYIETRDDVFQIEVMFRVINLGKMAWVPEQAVMELPADFKAFNASPGMGDTRFELVEGRGARLVGTYPPGQRDVSFRFQVPKPADTQVMFKARPPPRTVEQRVIAVASKNMTLSVDDFEPVQDSTGPRGDRVLVTRKLVSRGSPEVGPFVVTLSGLPVPGSGRWVAAGLALAFAFVGGAAAAGKLTLVSTERAEGDRARARELLLDELVSLEHAKQRSEIGPSAYDRTRRALADSLTRIGLPSEAKRVKRPLKEKRA